MDSNGDVVVLVQGEATSKKGGITFIFFKTKVNALMTK